MKKYVYLIIIVLISSLVLVGCVLFNPITPSLNLALATLINRAQSHLHNHKTPPLYLPTSLKTTNRPNRSPIKSSLPISFTKKAPAC